MSRPSLPAAAAVRLLLTGGLLAAWSTLAQAQAAPASAPQTRQAPAARAYDIHAGPLDTVLARFIAESGVPLAAPPDMVRGKHSQGLRGTYAVAAALDALLAGTELAAVARGDGAYTLRPAPGAAIATLPAIAVTGRGASDTATEGTGSYTAAASTSVAKLPLALREIPQTVTVVTRQKMDDFGLTNVDDVLASTSNVIVATQGADGGFYYSRGFALQMQYDGMMNPIGIGERNGSPSPDSAFLDRVDVLQGASGLLSGAGDPGGTVNLVRKRPTEQFQAQLETQLGSWQQRRLVGDVSGPLAESGKLRGRAVAVWDDSDSFMKHAYDEKRGFYGVIEADLSATTMLSASAQWQRNKGNNHLGVPTAPDGGDLRLPRSSFFAGQHDGIEKQYQIYTLSVEQKLPADWLLRASYSHNRAEADNASSYLWGKLDPVTGDGMRLYQQLLRRNFRANSYDVYASGPLTLLGRRHELVFGANGSSMRDQTRGYWNSGTAVNIYRYDADLPRPDSPLGNWSTPNETRQRGLYGVARLHLADPLKLIVGARVSWYEYRNEGVLKQKESSVVTPYAGLVYDIDGAHSVYASYADIFKPQDNPRAGGGTLDPIIGKNYELGVKGEYLGGRLNASAALFRLEQTNLAQIDQSVPYDESNACKGYCYSAAGLVVSKGVDLALNGEAAAGWQVGAGYTYVHSEHRKGPDQGKPYASNLPDHLFRLYTAYRLLDTKWTVGGNVKIQSRIFNSGADYTVRQGGYALVGLMAKYQLNKQAELSMTVDNLFDRRYYNAVGEPSFYTFYGAPRRFALNLKYSL